MMAFDDVWVRDPGAVEAEHGLTLLVDADGIDGALEDPSRPMSRTVSRDEQI
jgi:hypothetical protein